MVIPSLIIGGLSVALNKLKSEKIAGRGVSKNGK